MVGVGVGRRWKGVESIGKMLRVRCRGSRSFRVDPERRLRVGVE